MAGYRSSWLAKDIHGYLVIGTILVGVFIAFRIFKNHGMIGGFHNV